MRFSVNAASVARDFEGGTASVPSRLLAMRKMAEAGYPVGLTIAPIMPVEGWQAQYVELLDAAAEALHGLPAPDLTAELITHRFTPGSKEVLLGWYPQTPLEMDEARRAEKRTKFGGFKYIYPKDSMAEMRAFFECEIAARLSFARILYWTEKTRDFVIANTSGDGRLEQGWHRARMPYPVRAVSCSLEQP